MDSTNYNKADLLSVSLLEVRNIAKKFGVKSPTTYNKKELIDKVMEKLGDSANNELQKKTVDDSTNTEAKYLNKQKETKQSNVYDMSTDSLPDYSSHTLNEHNFTENTYITNGNSADVEKRSGYLDIIGNTSIDYGFLRINGYENCNRDAYIHANRIRKFGLRKGDYVEAIVNKSKAQDNKPAPVLSVVKVNGVDIEMFGRRPHFDDLTPIYPDKKIKLEIDGNDKDLTIRCIDIIAPIGKGQRALIVSPPKAGKTTLLKKIANSITTNYPDIDLEVLLVDERPEEVTDMQRTIKGNVWYSTFDEQPEHHIRVAEFLLDRAKRLVEMGKDVVILMDSLTRLARANNLVVNPTGRTLSGGIDPAALYLPKKFFGSARNIENGGSLTIIATALVDTGSRMDDVIFEEFKGTGNMEIRLDRHLSEKRIFPAIDLNQSSTRREDLLLSEDELDAAWTVRKLLSTGDPQKATESLISTMSNTKNNSQFVSLINQMNKDGFDII